MFRQPSLHTLDPTTVKFRRGQMAFVRTDRCIDIENMQPLEVGKTVEYLCELKCVRTWSDHCSVMDAWIEISQSTSMMHIVHPPPAVFCRLSLAVPAWRTCETPMQLCNGRALAWLFHNELHSPNGRTVFGGRGCP